MKTFTIDADNNITLHTSRKAARETGAGVFATEEQLADLIGPDNKGLVEVWNGLAGVKPVTKFANRKSATERIWKALQSFAEQTAAPVPEMHEVTALRPPLCIALRLSDSNRRSRGFIGPSSESARQHRPGDPNWRFRIRVACAPPS